MSLLLKALEKSEENQESTEAAGTQQEAGSSGSLGGMKLSGGGQSKLGSALAGAKKEKSAKKVVAAYQEDTTGAGEDSDDAQDALVKASRAALIKNIVIVVFVVAAGFGGWQAYQQFFPATQDEQETAGGGAASASQGQVEEVIDTTAFLPLAEPIYDIQENILTASVSSESSDSSGSQRDVIRDVQSYVERILEDQLRRSEEEERSSTANNNEVVGELTTSENEQLTALLSEEIDWETVEPVGNNAEMLAKLEALSQVETNQGAQQFIRKSGASVAVASTSTSEQASGSDTTEQQAEKPREVAQITKKSNELGNVMEQALVQYRSGDLNGSEISFRTILATEPRNTNALVGLSKVHSARGKNRLAVATLLKAAEYSPNDPLVITELFSIQSSVGSSAISESSVLQILGRANNQSMQSKLLFILGNIYAERQDWISAKSAYFEAHQLNSKNPDITYNLAVVYDFLGDKETAIEKYSLALTSALEQSSSFDHQVVRDRIDSLNNN